MDINTVFLMGRLGRDPEIKYLPSGTAVANLNVATNYSKKDKEKDEWISETVWHSVKIFGKVVDSYVSKFKKGDIVVVQGTIREDTWEDSEGNKKYKKYVLANNISGIFTGNENVQPTADKKEEQPVVKPQAESKQETVDDDLPF